MFKIIVGAISHAHAKVNKIDTKQIQLNFQLIHIFEHQSCGISSKLKITFFFFYAKNHVTDFSLSIFLPALTAISEPPFF
jgi:hypothetical protein